MRRTWASTLVVRPPADLSPPFRRKAPAAVDRTDDDLGHALAAAFDANGVLAPLNAAVTRRIDRGLDHHPGQHLAGRLRAAHLEATPADGGVHGPRLHLVQHLLVRLTRGQAQQRE